MSTPDSCDPAVATLNRWLVFCSSEQGEHRFVAENKATAWMMLEHYMREAEEASVIPTHLKLCWLDERGREHTHIDVHVGDVPQRPDVKAT